MTRVVYEQSVSIVELLAHYDSLDLNVLDEFAETLVAAAVEADPPWLLLDMSQTEYVSSSFIELLVRAWRVIERREGRMALCGVQPFCLEVLETTRLDVLWPIYPTRGEALAGLGKS